MSWWSGWIPAFGLTCVIEVPVYLVMFQVFGMVDSPAEHRGRLGRGRAALLALGVNAITHPLFWWVALRLDGTAALIVGELVVVCVEGLLIFAVLRRRPLVCLLCSLVANVTSAVLGSAILAAVTSSAASASTTSIWPG
jgi:hypothetical protein